MSDIPYPDTPQPDIPAPPLPDFPTPVPEVERYCRKLEV
jgi:hypothetical protein